MNWSSVQPLLRYNKTSEETAFVSNSDTRFLTKCLTNFILSNIIEIFRKIFTILQLRTVRGWRTFSGIFDD